MKHAVGCVIVCATLSEAEPLVRRLDGVQTGAEPFAVFQGADGEGRRPVPVVVSGMGLARTRKAMDFVFDRYAPELILNCGIAGSLSGDFAIGEIVRIGRAGTVSPGKSEIDWVAAEPGGAAGYRAARLVSVQEPLFDPRRKAQLRPFADLVDMEGAAVARACAEKRTPCSMLKIVSDDAEDRQLLLDNLHRLSDRLAEHIHLLLLNPIQQRRLA